MTKLFYLKKRGMGRAELARLILAYAEADYEDCRMDMEEWEELKPSKYYLKINSFLRL